METVICDASSLIALSETCVLDSLPIFKQKIKFVMPTMVEYECITRPLKIKQYSNHAYKIQNLVDKGIIEIIDEDKKFMNEIMSVGNTLFYKQGKPIHLIDKGECGMIASAKDRDINYMLIDERTTRTLIEAPEVLKKHFEDEFHINIATKLDNLERFREMTKNLKVFRSSELMIMAYKKGYFNSFKDPKAFLRSGLYKLKHSGCSLAFKEIDNFMKTL